MKWFIESKRVSESDFLTAIGKTYYMSNQNVYVKTLDLTFHVPQPFSLIDSEEVNYKEHRKLQESRERLNKVCKSVNAFQEGKKPIYLRINDKVTAYATRKDAEAVMNRLIENASQFDSLEIVRTWDGSKLTECVIKLDERTLYHLALGEAEEAGVKDLPTPEDMTKAGYSADVMKELQKQVIYRKAGFSDVFILPADWQSLLNQFHIQERKLWSIGGRNYWAWQGPSIAVVTDRNPVDGASANQRTVDAGDWVGRTGRMSVFGASDAEKKDTAVVSQPKAFDEFMTGLQTKGKATKDGGKPTVIEIPPIPTFKTKEVEDKKCIPTTPPQGKFKSWYGMLKNDPKFAQWVQGIASLSKRYLGADASNTFFAPLAMRTAYLAGQTEGQYVYSFAQKHNLNWAGGKADDDVRRELKASKEVNVFSLTEATLDSLNREFSDIPEDIREFIISQDFTRGDREVGSLAKPLLQLYKKSPDKDLKDLPKALKSYATSYNKKELSKYKFPSINQYSSIKEFIDDVSIDENPIIFDDGEWMVRELNSKEACRYYTSGMGWCTQDMRRKYYEDSYNKDKGDIYLIYKNDKIHSQMFVSKSKGFVEWMEPQNRAIKDYDEFFKDTTLLKFFYDNKILKPFEGLKFRGRKFKYEIIDGVYHFDNLDLSDISPKLKSLKEFQDAIGGSPYEVGGGFWCLNNQLTSLQGAPQKVGGDFSCSKNQLTSLQGAPQEVGGGFYCNHNQLTSLQGAPQKVGGNFSCYYNQFTSLQGAPQEVGGGFYCNHNQLTSLQGAPQKVGGNFSCRNNPGLLQKEINAYLKRIGKLKESKSLKEMAMPSKKLKSLKYYHGTAGEKRANKIWTEGLKPQASSSYSHYTGLFTPMEGNVYITNKLYTAYEYAQNTYDKIAPEDENKFAYIFEIDGTELKNVFPDEDQVGAAYLKAAFPWTSKYDEVLNVTQKDLQDPKYAYLNLNYEQERYLFGVAMGIGKSKSVLDFIKTHPEDLRDLKLTILVGKLIYPHLTDEERLDIIEKFGHVAHAGVLMPSKMWRISVNANGAFPIFRNMDDLSTIAVLVNTRDIENTSLGESLSSAKKRFKDKADKYKHLDPSPNFKYLEWICKAILKDGVTEQEAETRIPQTLQKWEQFLKRGLIPVENRDINSQSFDEVYDLLNDLEQKNPKSKKETHTQARADSEILFENDEWLVVVPYTEEASVYWGVGTKWCTTATKSENAFNQYAIKGIRLHYIISKDKDDNKKMAVAKFPQYLNLTQAEAKAMGLESAGKPPETRCNLADDSRVDMNTIMELSENAIPESIFRQFTQSERIELLSNILKGMGKEKDGGYVIIKDVNISGMGLTEIPIPIRYVDGTFDCSNNLLRNLNNAPKQVGAKLDISGNPLETLDGAPDSVGSFVIAIGIPTLPEEELRNYGERASGRPPLTR